MFTPSLNWHAATLFMAMDRDWKRKIFLGGLVLLIPLFGWPAILGYRKVVVERLVNGRFPILPTWQGQFWRYVWEGSKAIGVIYAYFSPVLIWFVVRATQSSAGQHVPWTYVAIFFAIFPILTPLAIPALTGYLVWMVPEPMVPAWEATGMMSLYTLITFFIPAGFLRVSRYGSILSAFHLADNLRLVHRSTRRYIEAWVGSAAISMIGHSAVPFSPWGVVWCYLGIVYAFNEVPYPNHRNGYLRHSWIRHVEEGFMDRYRASSDSSQSASWMTRYTTSDDEPHVAPVFRTIRIVGFEIPIG